MTVCAFGTTLPFCVLAGSNRRCSSGHERRTILTVSATKYFLAERGSVAHCFYTNATVSTNLQSIQVAELANSVSIHHRSFLNYNIMHTYEEGIFVLAELEMLSDVANNCLVILFNETILSVAVCRRTVLAGSRIRISRLTARRKLHVDIKITNI